jgi:hypothetical protein
MKIKDALIEFERWKFSGWSKSETPSSEALELAIIVLSMESGCDE